VSTGSHVASDCSIHPALRGSVAGR
jgi:hypothetical protein